MNWRIVGWIWTAVELACAATSWGGGYCRPNYGCYQQSYARSYYYPQVVNNLIGVPIPVPYTANIAQQGKSLYSYSSYNFAKPIDVSLMFTQAGRLVEQANALSQQGQAGMQQSMALAIEGSTKVSEINAKRDAAVAALKAAEVAGESLRYRLQAQSGQQLDLPPQPGAGESPFPAPAPGHPPPNGDGGDIVTVLQGKCLTCHQGTRVMKEGQLVETEHRIDLSKFVALPPELKAIVFGRIDSDDPEVRMPPEGRLTWREKMVFFQN